MTLRMPITRTPGLKPGAIEASPLGLIILMRSRIHVWAIEVQPTQGLIILLCITHSCQAFHQSDNLFTKGCLH